MHCLHWLVANFRISQYLSFRVKHCLCVCIRMYTCQEEVNFWFLLEPTHMEGGPAKTDQKGPAKALEREA